MVKKVFVAASEDDEEPTLIKKPYQKLKFKSAWEQSEFFRCALDPVYFINKYVYVSHPTKGRVPFKLYDYQINMVRAYQNNRQVVAMCSRQLGKCSTSNTIIAQDDKKSQNI